MPSDRVCPVTRPNIVTTPTCPVPMQEVDENAMTTPMPSSTSIPMPRTKVRCSLMHTCLCRQDTTAVFQSCFTAFTGSTRIARRAGK
ncbi:MAG TPA: hypothetical protein VF921_13945 [Vicinamibacterales bacterium]